MSFKPVVWNPAAVSTFLHTPNYVENTVIGNVAMNGIAESVIDSQGHQA